MLVSSQLRGQIWTRVVNCSDLIMYYVNLADGSVSLMKSDYAGTRGMGDIDTRKASLPLHSHSISISIHCFRLNFDWLVSILQAVCACQHI